MKFGENISWLCLEEAVLENSDSEGWVTAEKEDGDLSDFDDANAITGFAYLTKNRVFITAMIQKFDSVSALISRRKQTRLTWREIQMTEDGCQTASNHLVNQDGDTCF